MILEKNCDFLDLQIKYLDATSWIHIGRLKTKRFLDWFFQLKLLIVFDCDWLTWLVID